MAKWKTVTPNVIVGIKHPIERSLVTDDDTSYVRLAAMHIKFVISAIDTRENPNLR